MDLTTDYQRSPKFRRGTKSCIECRQRKIRCFWPSDSATTCRNCLDRHRTCVLQNVAARNPETLRLSSRDRIARLEGSVASLWKYLKTQQPNALPDTIESAVGGVREDKHCGDSENDSESSEMSDPSPANPPKHLQLLFENSLLDLQDVREQAPRHHKFSEARLSRARTALQGLMASEEDASVLTAHATEWLASANAIVPLVFIARTKDELILDWDQARQPDAQPTTIAAVVLITALTIHTIPQSALHDLSGQLSDTSAYSRAVSDAIETYIVNDDVIAGSLEGIEVCMLFQRLHFAHARIQKVWLSIRRTIALAEIIGLPRASVYASSADRSGKPALTRRGQTREVAGASLWQAACTMDRLAGCMFGLHITTRMYPLPTDRPVFVGAQLVPQAYFCRLADIAGKIPVLDELYAKGQPSLQVCEMVSNIDRELRELANLAPNSWWDLDPNQKSVTPDRVFQYFHQYFTARVHLQLALKNDGSTTYAYSHRVCTEACRNMAVRYAILRPRVLGGFFPVRVFDLQALTAAIFLLHICYGPGSSQEIEATRTPPSHVLIQQIVDSMDSVSEGKQGHFAQEAAHTIRSLSALLSNNYTTDSRYVSLRVPLLGRIHVSRQDAKPKPAEQLAGSFAMQSQAYGTYDANSLPLLQSGSTANAMPLNAVANSPHRWSMEISEVVPFLTDDAHAPDQWLTLGGFNIGGFGFKQL